MSDLTPNVGLSWYFFTEMFDHFRTFFTGIFQVGPTPDIVEWPWIDSPSVLQLHVLIYIVPVCIRLQYASR